jgi:hypothetical protein
MACAQEKAAGSRRGPVVEAVVMVTVVAEVMVVVVAESAVVVVPGL